LGYMSLSSGSWPLTNKTPETMNQGLSYEMTLPCLGQILAVQLEL
jgi:hypothetical protein